MTPIAYAAVALAFAAFGIAAWRAFDAWQRWREFKIF